MNRARRRLQRGSSLVETMLVASLMATVLTTIGIGLRAGHSSRREMQRKVALTAVASELLDRLERIPFGNDGDAGASGGQLDELFDGDTDLGSATLISLRGAPGAEGPSFALQDFPWGGMFEVRVDADLNGDGDEDDDREGRPDLLRINILWDGKLLIESIRAAPWRLP